MCGIIGVTSKDDAQDYLISRLKRLEYRGYDSSGIATIHNNSLCSSKAEGKIKNLAFLISLYICSFSHKNQLKIST